MKAGSRAEQTVSRWRPRLVPMMLGGAIAAGIVAAAALTVMSKQAGREDRLVSLPAAAADLLSPSGKVLARFDDPGAIHDGEMVGPSLISAAALMMPMGLDWVGRVEAATGVQSLPAIAETRRANAPGEVARAVSPMPPVRPASLALTAPLPIQPALADAGAPQAEPQPGLLRRVGAPVVELAGTLAGAAGAAGSWTIGQAVSLAPRW